jgi:hypothetical protein
MKNTKLLFAKVTDFQLLARSSKELPKPLFHVAVGQLLSDAHADKSSPTSNTRLTWSFGTGYKQYANYVGDLFNAYCNKGVYSVNVLAKKGGDSYVNYRLKTATLPIFNALYDMFYILCPVTGKRVKIVPLNIDCLMSPITLAHLIMGDGGYNKASNMVRIFTYNFTLEDCPRLAQSITNMNIETQVKYDRLGKNGEKQYILKIDGSQLKTLCDTVTPHMESSMYYRVGLSIK